MMKTTNKIYIGKKKKFKNCLIFFSKGKNIKNVKFNKKKSIDSDTGLERPNLKSAPAEKLGMVDGVMIPVMLSIWGVILFLRLGVLTGQVKKKLRIF